MRIWSIHPKYLDNVGLVALWRETLLARHVLEGRTKGYVNHPQLNRFKACINPLQAINLYLEEVYNEAKRRQYNFDSTKFEKVPGQLILPVTEGQVQYEFRHLLNKLKERNINKYNEIIETSSIVVHSLFQTVPGAIESWEQLP